MLVYVGVDVNMCQKKEKSIVEKRNRKKQEENGGGSWWLVQNNELSLTTSKKERFLPRPAEFMDLHHVFLSFSSSSLVKVQNRLCLRELTLIGCVMHLHQRILFSEVFLQVFQTNHSIFWLCGFTQDYTIVYVFGFHISCGFAEVFAMPEVWLPLKASADRILMRNRGKKLRNRSKKIEKK